MKHKYKKEFKGALREIRKDSRFLAHEKLSEIMSRYDSAEPGGITMTLTYDLTDSDLSIWLVGPV